MAEMKLTAEQVAHLRVVADAVETRRPVLERWERRPKRRYVVADVLRLLDTLKVNGLTS